uniref:Hemocyanin C-terminal domain-containing protein n=1 Tax=Anopheles coluzzii TaxID=1518534 RepID=A0A8W7PG51_ANOCL
MKLLILAVAISLAVLASGSYVPSTKFEAKYADKEFLFKQKFFFEVLRNIHLPLKYDEYIPYTKTWVSDETKYNDFAQVAEFFDYYKTGAFLEKGELFSIYNEQYLRQTYASADKYFDYAVFARQRRLNHKPFSYTMNVMSDYTGKAIIRAFVGPKFDRFFDLQFYKKYFFEIDQYLVDFTAGKNTFVRNSRDFYWSVKDRTMYTDLYKKIMLGYNGQEKFALDMSEAHCGFPDRLILPKGWTSGMPMQFYFIITPYTAKTYEQGYQYDKTFTCGVESGMRFYDSLPFGYPFDRVINFNYFYTKNILISIHTTSAAVYSIICSISGLSEASIENVFERSSFDSTRSTIIGACTSPLSPTAGAQLFSSAAPPFNEARLSATPCDPAAALVRCEAPPFAVCFSVFRSWLPVEARLLLAPVAGAVPSGSLAVRRKCSVVLNTFRPPAFGVVSEADEPDLVMSLPVDLSRVSSRLGEEAADLLLELVEFDFGSWVRRAKISRDRCDRKLRFTSPPLPPFEPTLADEAVRLMPFVRTLTADGMEEDEWFALMPPGSGRAISDSCDSVLLVLSECDFIDSASESIDTSISPTVARGANFALATFAPFSLAGEDRLSSDRFDSWPG